MSVLAIAGLCVIVGFWTLLFGTIWTQIVVTRRRARQRGEPAHSISWIEFVPIVLIATAATFLLNRWRHRLGSRTRFAAQRSTRKRDIYPLPPP